MIALCRDEPRSQGWLDVRREGITATDVPAILGVHKWKTAGQVWEDKLGLADPVEDNVAMRVGRALEPGVLALAAEVHGAIKSWPDIPSIVGSDEWPLLRASLDGMDQSGHPVEAKVTRTMWSELPEHVRLQALTQAHVVGAEYTTVAVVAGSAYEEWTVHADNDEWAWITGEVETWWHRFVLGGEQPSATADDDLAARWTPDPDESAEVDEHLWTEYRIARNLEADAVAARRVLEAAVQGMAGPATTVLVGGERVATWNPTKPRRTVDATRLKKEYPTIWATVLKEGKPGRRWTVK